MVCITQLQRAEGLRKVTYVADPFPVGVGGPLGCAVTSQNQAQYGQSQ